MSDINRLKKKSIQLLMAAIAMTASLSAALKKDDFDGYQCSTGIGKPVAFKNLKQDTSYSFTIAKTSPPQDIKLGEHNDSIHGTIEKQYTFTPDEKFTETSLRYWVDGKQKGRIDIKLNPQRIVDDSNQTTAKEDVTLQNLTDQIAELREDNASFKQSIAYLSHRSHNQNKAIKYSGPFLQDSFFT